MTMHPEDWRNKGIFRIQNLWIQAVICHNGKLKHKNSEDGISEYIKFNTGGNRSFPKNEDGGWKGNFSIYPEAVLNPNRIKLFSRSSMGWYRATWGGYPLDWRLISFDTESLASPGNDTRANETVFTSISVKTAGHMVGGISLWYVRWYRDG